MVDGGAPGSKVFNVVPRGPATRERAVLLGRFPLGDPGVRKGSAVEWKLQREAGSKSNQRSSSSSAAPPAWELHGTEPQSGASRTLHGVPDTTAISNYFILMKSGDNFTALPVQALTFRPVQRSSGTPLTLEEAEALMQGKGQQDPGDALAPRYMRETNADDAFDARLRAEAKAALGARADELEALFGEADDLRPKRPKLVVGADDSDAPEEDDDELGFAEGRKGRKGRTAAGGQPGKGKKGAAAAAAAAAPGDDGPGEDAAISEDEAPEDVYKGEEDELRPEAPDEEADWEHEQEVQDDDEDIGQTNEEYDNDAHMRKKLGLDQNEEEERDEERQQAEALQRARAATQAANREAGPQVKAELEQDEDEDDEDLDDMLSDMEDMDLADLDAMVAAKELTRKTSGPGEAAAAATQQQIHQRMGTPPPGATTTAAARGKTPPSAAAGSGRQRGPSKSPAPASAVAAAAGAGGGGQRGRSRTPPVQGVGKRWAGDAAAEGAGPTAKRSRRSTPPPGAAAGRVPTRQEITAAVQENELTLIELVNMFLPRVVTVAERQEFRALVLDMTDAGANGIIKLKGT